MESLNLKNGQNPNLANLNAQNNTTLTCIETDTGAAPIGVTWLKDALANYSIQRYYGETYVPDDNFEQALIDLGYDSGVLDDYVLTANIENISILNISNQNILDLTGIEDFFGLLTNFNFEGNSVVNLNFSTNILLKSLNASSNAITTIDVSANTNLNSLNVSNNSISQINLN